MHIVTVKKFLFCFKLETGGYFLGWLGTILTTLAIIGMATLAVVSIFAFDLIKEALKEQSLSNSTDDVIAIDSWIIEMTMESQIFLEVFLVLIIIMLFVALYANIMLLLGTKNRTANRLIPYLVLSVLGIIANFAKLATFNWQSVLDVVITTTIDVYLYICVYSLYIKFKSGKEYRFPDKEDA